MKTKRFCKSTVSLILVFMMLVSMLTVGIVNTSAAEVDTAETGESGVYLRGGTINNWGWGDKFQLQSGTIYKLDFTFNSTGEHWIQIHYDHNNYRANSEINDVTDASGVTLQQYNDNFKWKVSTGGTYTFTFDTSTKVLTITNPNAGGDTTPTVAPTVEPTVAPTEKPTTPSGDPTSLTKLYFMDNSSDQFMDNFDADIYASFDSGKKQQMKQRVDTMSGKTLWSIDIPDGATNVKFYRYSKLDKLWGEWSTVSLSGITSGYYKAISGSGSWETDESTFSPSSDEDITNFWYGVWVDSKGNGNAHDSVRWWKDSSGYYHIFLPAYTPSTFKLYTSFDSFTVNSKTVTRGNYIEMSNVNFSSYYSMSYVKSGTTTAGRVYFHKTVNPANSDYGVSTLLFTTDDQFWTETTDDYLSDVSGYKDAIETKGSIYLYDKDGNLVNSGSGETKLKKIKGRGNSSFQASMDLYGKYAYNFNLDKNVSLIDGATKTKKWCLLANNVDHAMLRNTFAYSLAADLGLNFSPKTRPVDVFDNGEYLGSYTITEKVEYGEKSLMNTMANLDDANEEANLTTITNDEGVEEEVYVFDDLAELTQVETYTTINGTRYDYQYSKSADSKYTYNTPEKYREYNYLLEFELHDRFDNEASWFYSARTKQAVVVKYPEFATQDEMLWIMSEYEAMEKAVYANDYATYSGLIDVDSFAKVYLIQELALNLDSCATSYYIHNEFTNAEKTQSKLVAGPVWDYDWSFGSYAGAADDSYKQKPIYNGSSTVSNGKSMANPNQMFVKVKALKTDNNQSASYVNNYNLQAKLAQNSSFWTECKKIWTNDMVDILNKYVVNKYITNDTSGIIVDKWLPGINSSVTMNKIRWSNARMAEEWGTKKTDNYTYGSHSFNYNDRSSSGSSSANYANTVYYLNDWIAARWNYMSSEKGGKLYDATLLDPYELKSVTMNAVHTENDVTVNVAFDATYNGTQVDNQYKRFELYVNGELEGDYAITDAPVVTIPEDSKVSVYVIAYLSGDKAKYNMTSDSQSFEYQDFGPVYKVENVTFKPEQSADESKVTITPSANATVDGVDLAANKYQYTVYLNGAEYVTKTFETVSATINLEKGKVNSIYVVVSPVDKPEVTGTSITQKFSYAVEAEKIEVTLNFKSSTSYRYIPSVVVGGTTTPMDKKANSSIGKNKSQTQSYCWFTTTVEIPKDTATKITFKNSYSMSADVTLKLSEATELFYGVDNLNDGSIAVDLTQYNTTNLNDQAILNFKQSASHMVHSDENDAELATTSINGTVYKLGDATGDKSVNIMDATAVQLSLAQKSELTETGAALADFNQDSTKSIMDVTMIQTYIAQ